MRPGGFASPKPLASALVTLAIGVVFAVLVVVQQHDQAVNQAKTSVRETVANSVSVVRTEIRNEMSAATGAPATAIVPANRLGHPPFDPTNAILARDSGNATLDDTTPHASVVAPVYRGGQPPTTTTARRNAIVAYRVVPLTLGPTMLQLRPDTGGLIVRGPHRIVSSAPAHPPLHALTFGVDMDLTGMPGWVVQAWLPHPGIPGVAWLWALAVFAVFAALATTIAVLQQRADHATARMDTMLRNRSLVTGLIPVLHASLDLGEVAPALAAHLADGLQLAGVSLSAPGELGEKQLFVYGTPPDPAVRPVSAAPRALGAGETYALALTRGGRTLGILRVVTGVPLSRDTVAALGTTSEMAASTLANAETLARQQELVDRMRSVDELKTVFLATASHELRTPVTAIVGFSVLLLDRWDTMAPTQQRNLLERIAANGKRLNTLIEQLLDFSQLERGLPRPSDHVLDLGATVRRILSEQAELAAGHELVIDTATGCQVRGSTAAVERIVTNLVGNAAKYSPPNTTITVTVQCAGQTAQLLVDDQGSGVPPEDRQRVFSRFYRGRGESVSRTRGAGIGLAIVSEYAAAMSGAVSVSDAPGGGARFNVSFPLLAVAGGSVSPAPDEGELHVPIS